MGMTMNRMSSRNTMPQGICFGTGVPTKENFLFDCASLKCTLITRPGHCRDQEIY